MEDTSIELKMTKEKMRKKKEKPVGPQAASSKDKMLCLPAPLQIKILSSLQPDELLRLRRVSKGWKLMLEKNELWWNHAMKLLWTPSEIPLKPSMRDLRKQPGKYMIQYLEAVDRNLYAAQLVKAAEREKRQAIREERSRELEWANQQESSKDEMRAYYKTVRSNPKGKKPVRDRSHKMYIDEEDFYNDVPYV